MDRTQNIRILMSIVLVGGVALVAGVYGPAIVQSPASRYHMTKLSDLHSPLGSIPYWQVGVSSEWANEAWTGDDTPYQSIELEVDKSLITSWSISDLLQQASTQAQQKPVASKALFRWAYLARQVVRAQPKTYFSYPAIQMISVVLAHGNSPKTYSYARLRFLVSDQNPAFTELGERLLQRDPNDNSVKYYLSIDYSALFSKRSQRSRNHEVDSQLKQRALTLAEQVIAASPADPDYRAALAAVYVASWDDKKNSQDAANGIAAYQKYLKLETINDDNRKRCYTMMAPLQEYLAANPLP